MLENDSKPQPRSIAWKCDTNSIQSSVQLEELNEDCLMNIFESLGDFDLMTLSKSIPSLRSVTEDELRRRYLNKSLKLMPYPPSYDLSGEQNEISIANETVAKTIMEFSELIRSLTIQELSSPLNEIVDKLINDHCSETLTEIRIQSLHHDFFQSIKKPFKKVVNVSLEFKIDFGNDQLNFNEMFPAMRRLELSHIRTKNANKLILNYPNLEHLTVCECVISLRNENILLYTTEPVITGLLIKNPQLRSLVLHKGTPNLLKFIADELPKLEHLVLYSFNRIQPPQSTHFQHLKTFKIGSFSYYWPKNITFSENLEEFEMTISSKDKSFDYIGFVENRKNLKKIQITFPLSFEKSEILKLADLKSNGKEISLIQTRFITTNVIIGLIRNNNHLHSLRLTTSDKNEFLLIEPELREFYENSNWNINLEPIGGNHFQIIVSKRIDLDWRMKY